MTQYSFPWDDVDGDRLYKSEDFKRFFSAFLKTGVVMSNNDGLRVRSAQNGMNIQVGAGAGVINGGSYVSDTSVGFQVNVASSLQDRKDSIVLKEDEGSRETYLYYKSNDTTVTRNETTYELQLAIITVPKNATQITDVNITDMRGVSTVCGWCTPFDNVNVDGLVDQYKAIFEQGEEDFLAWFENIKGQLSEDVAGNLQNQINSTNTELAKKATDSSVLHLTGNETSTGKKKFESISVDTLAVTGDTDGWQNVTPKNGFSGSLKYRIHQGVLFIRAYTLNTPSISANTPVVFGNIAGVDTSNVTGVMATGPAIGSGLYVSYPCLITGNSSGDLYFTRDASITAGYKMSGGVSCPL